MTEWADLPAKITTEEELEDLLSRPTPELVEMMKRLDGDIMILGIAGKMGITLGMMAVRAIREAGVQKKVIGVSRFSSPGSREQLEKFGLETIPCDLLDRDSVASLPVVPNVMFMAGRKFGTGGEEDLTWAMNSMVPANVGEHFRTSRIVAFSTGCVYPLVGVETCGCDESVAPLPVGEYAQSCLGRERVFSYCSRTYGTPVCLYRLNYAIDLRYGVLHDIAQQIISDEPVTASVGHFNIIWQGDANSRALQCLEHCASPASVMNITGPETVSLVWAAERLGALLGKEVRYSDTPGTVGYLNNAAKSFRIFGYPHISVETMIDRVAAWVKQGGASLGKPTHFEVNNGKF